MAKIHEAMAAIVREIGAVGKDQRNAQQNYKFRGIDDVCNALHGLMAKHEIYISPRVTDQKRETHQSKGGGTLFYSVLTMEFVFTASDGSKSDPIVMAGEGMDSGDKATNKAMSAAFKYAMIQAFCIPTAEPKDSEYDDHDVAPPQARVEDRRATAVVSANWRDTMTPKGRRLGNMPVEELLEAELYLSKKTKRSPSEEAFRVATLTGIRHYLLSLDDYDLVSEHTLHLEEEASLEDERAVLREAVSRIQAWPSNAARSLSN